MILGHFHTSEESARSFVVHSAFDTLSYLHGDDAPVLLQHWRKEGPKLIGELECNGLDLLSQGPKIIVFDKDQDGFLSSLGAMLDEPIVLADISSGSPMEQYALTESISKTYPGSKILIYAPDITEHTFGIAIDRRRPLPPEPKKDISDFDAAFDAFIDDIAGIKEPEEGIVISTPQKCFAIEPLPKKPTKEIEIIDEVWPSLKRNGANIGFAAVFMVLSIAMTFICDFFPKHDDSTFATVCFLLTIAFVGLSIVPVCFIAKDEGSLRDPSTRMVLLIQNALAGFGLAASVTSAYYTAWGTLAYVFGTVFFVGAIFAWVFGYLVSRKPKRKKA